MPIATNSLPDVNIPTVNGDADTWGQILIDYFTALDSKIHDLQTRITTAETQLGSSSTVGSVSYANDRVTNINTHAQNAGLVAADLLTGTNTTILPDPFSGNHTMMTSFPYFTGSGEILDGVTPPTTESEINAFGFQSFAQALLNYCTNTIQPKVSQAEADLLQARIDTCKAKKFIDAREAGGVTQKIIGAASSYFWTNPDNGSGSGSYIQKAIYQVATTSSGNADYSYSGGLLTVAYSLVSDPVYPYGNTSSTNLQAHNRFTSNGYLTSGSFVNVYANFVDISGFSVGSTVNLMGFYSPPGNPFFSNGNVGIVGMQIQNATMQIKWQSTGLIVKIQYVPTGSSTQAQVNAVSPNVLGPISTVGSFTIGLSKHTIAEQTIYTTPDVSSCDTSPGGPYYATGSYS
tara:strand:- start:429 stop:1640 length:1212 start_codon:yes stop_codon:yes gene_type:complete